MRRRNTYRRPIHHSALPSAEATRHQLASMIVTLFGLCCALALFGPDSPMLERLLIFLAQQLALVIGYYFGQKGR